MYLYYIDKNRAFGSKLKTGLTSIAEVNEVNNILFKSYSHTLLIVETSSPKYNCNLPPSPPQRTHMLTNQRAVSLYSFCHFNGKQIRPGLFACTLRTIKR